MIEAGCCRICEKNFTEQFQLVIHMWANHCRYDMPYACGICDYRSSLKFQVIDHFNLVSQSPILLTFHTKQQQLWKTCMYIQLCSSPVAVIVFSSIIFQAHQGAASILCPICLQVLNCQSSANLAEILAHAQVISLLFWTSKYRVFHNIFLMCQLHQFNEGHRCGHCALVFPLPKELKAHFQEGFHTSKRRARNSRKWRPPLWHQIKIWYQSKKVVIKTFHFSVFP